MHPRRREPRPESAGDHKGRSSGCEGFVQAHFSWSLLAEQESDTANRVEQFHREWVVQLLSQTANMDIDHIVERRSASRFFPYVSRQHFAGDDTLPVASQKLQ